MAIRVADAGLRAEVPHLRHDPHHQGDGGDRGGPLPGHRCPHGGPESQAQRRSSVFVEKAYGCRVSAVQVGVKVDKFVPSVVFNE